MKLMDLQSSNPPLAVRAILVGEVILCVAGAAACIWFLGPTRESVLRWYHATLPLLAAVPIGLNLLHGDRPADSGLRLDNWRASAKGVLLATVAMAAGIVLIGLLARGFHWVSAKRLANLVGLYPLWGIVQQYFLQAFMLRRLRQARIPPPAATILAAGLFGLLHAPNWALVATVTFAGIVGCTLFLRRPNLITLGLAHGVLAVLLYHAWPKAWLQGMTIGPMFLEKVR
jgi:hypothetical protein